MKIKLSHQKFVVLGLSLLLSLSGFAQAPNGEQKKSAEDGDPIFNSFRTGFDPGIALTDGDGVLQLAPIIVDTTFVPSIPWKLDGVRWQYSNAPFAVNDLGYISHAVDVDDVSAVMGEPVYLITDQGSNKVIAYSLSSGLLSWDYRSPGANYTLPTDAQLFEENNGGTVIRYVLITWKGTNVVTKITYDGKNRVWQYGVPSTSGIDDGFLNSPSDAEKIVGTPEVLIADTGNKRVIIVDETRSADQGPVIWTYTGPDAAFSPVDVQYLNDPVLGEQVLITDQAGHRVFLVSRADSSVTWTFGTGVAGSDSTQLRNPSDADWNPSTRRVVIADKGNNRVLEVSPEDPAYYYLWPNDVNSVDDVDPFSSSNGFLVCRKQTIDDAEVWLPSVIEFSAEPKEVLSPIIDLGKDVDFESLTFSARHLTPATQVLLQFRSSSSFPNEGLAWLGPDGTPNSYYSPTQTELFAGHKIHRYCQVKALISTTDTRVTPIVDDVHISYTYYDIAQRPHVYSRLTYTIGASESLPHAVAVTWDTLLLAWKPAEEERLYLSNLAFIASLNNADDPDRTLLNLGPLPVTFEPTRIPLAGYAELIGAQRLGLVVTLISYNTSLTPRLDKWRVAWREKELGAPAVRFVDAAGNPKDFYTAAAYVPAPTDSIFSDQTYVQLANIQESETSFRINIVSNRSFDVESVTVQRDVANAQYSTLVGIPTVIVEDPVQVIINNDTLEVYDRDTLSAQFTSSLRPTEILADTIQVVQGTLGQLFAVNELGQPITRAQLDQRVYARLTDELDKSLDLTAQDTVHVVFYNPSTNDREQLVLYEEQSSDGQYGSGIFSSQNGVVIRNILNYTPDDGSLYGRPNDVIQLIYLDNFKKPEFPTRQFVTVPDSIVIQMAQALTCQVAPNPYFANSGTSFRMRLGSSLGNVTVQKLEIFNLAAEKVAEMTADQIQFVEWGANSIPVNQYGHFNNWWNLQNDSNDPVSSGTYWVKVSAEVANTGTGAVEKLTALAKFVVIR